MAAQKSGRVLEPEKQVKAQILKLQYPPYPKSDSWSHVDTDGLIPNVFLLQVLQKTRHRLSYTEWTRGPDDDATRQHAGNGVNDREATNLARPILKSDGVS